MLKFLLLILTLNLLKAEYNFNSFESNEISLPSLLNIEKPAYSNIQLDSKESLNVYNNPKNNGQCQEITVPMCRNIEYNMTSFPNQFNHETQEEAAAEAHQFWALVEINCAKELKFFLCSMYTPICVPNYPQPIKACKSVCVRARLGCEKYMKKFGFEWPDHMNCELFPEYGSSKEVCMDPMDAEEQQKRKQLNINHNLNGQNMDTSDLAHNTLKTNKNLSIKQNKKLIDIDYDNEVIKSEWTRKNRDFELLNKMCVHPFTKINDPQDYRYNKFHTSSLKNCIQPCQSVYFSHQERQLTYYWLLFWSFLCLFSSFCTTCTYLIESSRFRYPEKPIIYMSICFLFITLGYMLRFMIGHEQACESDNSIRYSNTNNLNSISCTSTFILTYYFGMAASIWWVVISLTWFLAAGLKWSTEAISRYGIYFHLIAWVVPFVKTFIILSLSLVDGDSLSGMCFVGNLNTYNLKVFVIYPAIVYISIGIAFLLAGFVSLVRIRNMIKRQHSDLKKAHKLEKLMIRIGIFSILYTVPVTCVIACQVYELYYRDEWEKTILCKNKNFKRSLLLQFEENYSLVNEFCSNNRSELLPEFSIFLIKYFMALIIGITSGFWIWTEKSLQSWRKFFRRIFGIKYSPNQDSSLEDSDVDESCFAMFSPKKRVCKIQKNSVIYFKANDDDKSQANFYEIDSLKNKEFPNIKFPILYPQNNTMQTHIIYQKPDSQATLTFNTNQSNSISKTSTNGPHSNNFFINQYKLMPNDQTKSATFIYDSSTLYKNLPPTVNTTTTTNASSLPSTVSIHN